MIKAVVIGLILLHAPGGRVIQLNPDAIVSLHAAVEGQPNKVMTDEARCVVNTMDGKFISVVESCETIRNMMEKKP